MDYNNVLANLYKKMSETTLIKNSDDIKIGDIIYMDLYPKEGIVINNGYPTRKKYVVIAGAKNNKKDFVVALINSKANYSNDEIWLKEQYPLKEKDYAEFLEYNSWIDCTSLFPKSLKQMKAQQAKKIGHLIDADFQNIMNKFKNSDFINADIKKTYHIN